MIWTLKLAALGIGLTAPGQDVPADGAEAQEPVVVESLVPS